MTRDDRLARVPLLLLGGPIVSQNSFSPHDDDDAAVGPLLGLDRLPEWPGTLLLQGEQVSLPIALLLLLLASAVPLSFSFLHHWEWTRGCAKGTC